MTTLSEDDTVLDLKQFLKTLTGVLPERQKLLGLKVKGKPAENDVKLGALKLKPNTKIMMMGTREESLEDVLGPPPDNDDVVNDFDIEDEVVEVENREENLLKISRRVKEYKVEILNPPREGKKLLVLDVDYTLFGKSVNSAFHLLLPTTTFVFLLFVFFPATQGSHEIFENFSYYYKSKSFIVGNTDGKKKKSSVISRPKDDHS